MLAPAPPRCCTRSSTRKDSDTFSICPSTNCSVKVPGKVIRWSVAIEPVTHTVTGALPRGGVEADHRGSTLLDSGLPGSPTSLGAPTRACRPGAVGEHPAQRQPELA